MINDYTDLYYLINLPLNNTKSYYCDLIIDSINCNFYFEWNERLGTRYLSIVTSSGTTVLSRTPLFSDNEIYMNVNAKMIGLNDVLIKLVKKDLTKPDDLLNWSDNYYIFIKGIFSDVYDDFNKFKLSLLTD